MSDNNSDEVIAKFNLGVKHVSDATRKFMAVIGTDGSRSNTYSDSESQNMSEAAYCLHKAHAMWNEAVAWMLHPPPAKNCQTVIEAGTIDSSAFGMILQKMMNSEMPEAPDADIVKEIRTINELRAEFPFAAIRLAGKLSPAKRHELIQRLHGELDRTRSDDPADNVIEALSATLSVLPDVERRALMKEIEALPAVEAPE